MPGCEKLFYNLRVKSLDTRVNSFDENKLKNKLPDFERNYDCQKKDSKR